VWGGIMKHCQYCQHKNRLGATHCEDCKSIIAQPAITRNALAQHITKEIIELYTNHKKIAGKAGVYLIDTRFADFEEDLIVALSNALKAFRKFSDFHENTAAFNNFIFNGISDESLSTDNNYPKYNEIITLLSYGCEVFIAHHDLDLIDPKIKRLAMGTLVIPRFTPITLRQACVTFFNNNSSDTDLSWSRHIIPEDLLINAEVAQEPISHIYESMMMRLKKYQCNDAHELDELYAFGEARDWAKDWSKDAREIQSGSSSVQWTDIERGILLVGQHGMGKLNFAKSLAKASGMHLVECSVEGILLSDMNELLLKRQKEARLISPAILYVHAGNTECNLDVSLFDNFDEKEPVFILIARIDSNIPDYLLRAKRLERVFKIPYPTARILKEVYRPILKESGFELSQIEIDQLSKSSQGYVTTLARAEQIVRSAKRQARRNNKSLSLMDLIDQVYEIPGNSARTLPEDKIRDTAFHEAGHAVMMLLSSKGMKDITYLSVVPKDDYLGFTSYCSDENDPDETRRNLIESIRVMLGGRAAEEIHMGIDRISTGPSSDLASATNVAQYMITSCGLGQKGSLVSWYPDLSRNTELREEIDVILKEEYHNTVDALKQNWPLVENLVEAVMEAEEITGNEMREIYRNYLDKKISIKR